MKKIYFLILVVLAAGPDLVVAQTLTLDYSTYLGGSGGDFGYSIDVDSEGSAWITGYTESVNFPTENAYQPVSGGGGKDVFVSKLSSGGSLLICSTYLGGGDDDYGTALAISEGSAWITGYTWSSDFPTENAYQPVFGGGTADGFLSKLSSGGSELLYSTYLGGGGNDYGQAVLIESGDIYMTGYTASTDFPTESPYQSSYGGGSVDGFVCKLSSSGSGLIYSTYLGGSAADWAFSLSLESGMVYVAGDTQSSDFPTSNPYQPSRGAGMDAFVTKLSSGGSWLSYSTYLGGSDTDRGDKISAESGTAYLIGRTYSADFPTKNAYQSSYAGGAGDAYVSKLASGGSCLLYSTYLGGSGEEWGYDISTESGTAYVSGATYSYDFPTMNAYQASYAGSGDAFVSRLSSSGTGLVYSTYLGGFSVDYGEGFSVEAGTAYVTGRTFSGDFPTVNAYQSSKAESYDAYISKLSFTTPTTTPAPSPSPTPENYVCELLLDYSTYLGGGGNDYGQDIAVGDDSATYVTGYTAASDFPTADAYQAIFSGGAYDAFLSKFSSDGQTLVFSTYLGGGGNDYGRGVDVGSDGRACVAGSTGSLDFPVENAYQAVSGGDSDAFVTLFSSSGSTLEYSTYFGGGGIDDGYAVALNTVGRVHVTGTTLSTDFPTRNAYQAGGGGDYDVFVAKFFSDGSSLVFSTYLGGAGYDAGRGIDVDDVYCASVAGYTASTDFPLENAYQASHGGGSYDAFAAKFNLLGNNLLYSTYLGGDGDDIGYDLALDSNRNAYVAGRTQSPDFPTRNPYQAFNRGLEDIFVTKLTTDGSGLEYSTYIGGTSSERGYGIAVGPDNSAYLNGYTISSVNYPLQNPYQPSFGGSYDFSVTRLSPAGSALIYSTYLGGQGRDEGRGIAVDTDGTACITGYTESADFPTADPYQATFAGNYDAIVAKFAWECHYTTPTATPSATPTATPTPTPRRFVPGDFSGDGTADIAVFRDTSGLWAVRGVSRIYFGSETDTAVPGDYDGDGTADLGVFRDTSGLWALRGLSRVYFGATGDDPVPADYDGDCTGDIAIFRDSSGLWALRNITRIYFGENGDLPVPADFDGDGRAEVTVFRDTSGLWAVRGVSRIYFGSETDTAVPGDYDGDGTADIAVFRDSSGLWALRGISRVYFGESADQPVPADYDGNATGDIAIFRETSGLWAVKGLTRVYYGTTGDIPVTR